MIEEIDREMERIEELLNDGKKRFTINEDTPIEEAVKTLQEEMAYRYSIQEREKREDAHNDTTEGKLNFIERELKKEMIKRTESSFLDVGVGYYQTSGGLNGKLLKMSYTFAPVRVPFMKFMDLISNKKVDITQYITDDKFKGVGMLKSICKSELKANEKDRKYNTAFTYLPIKGRRSMDNAKVCFDSIISLVFDFDFKHDKDGSHLLEVRRRLYSLNYILQVHTWIMQITRSKKGFRFILPVKVRNMEEVKKVVKLAQIMDRYLLADPAVHSIGDPRLFFAGYETAYSLSYPPSANGLLNIFKEIFKNIDPDYFKDITWDNLSNTEVKKSESKVSKKPKSKSNKSESFRKLVNESNKVIREWKNADVRLMKVVKEVKDGKYTLKDLENDVCDNQGIIVRMKFGEGIVGIRILLNVLSYMLVGSYNGKKINRRDIAFDSMEYHENHPSKYIRFSSSPVETSLGNIYFYPKYSGYFFFQSDNSIKRIPKYLRVLLIKKECPKTGKVSWAIPLKFAPFIITEMLSAYGYKFSHNKFAFAKALAKSLGFHYLVPDCFYYIAEHVIKMLKKAYIKGEIMVKDYFPRTWRNGVRAKLYKQLVNDLLLKSPFVKMYKKEGFGNSWFMSLSNLGRKQMDLIKVGKFDRLNEKFKEILFVYLAYGARDDLEFAGETDKCFERLYYSILQDAGIDYEQDRETGNIIVKEENIKTDEQQFSYNLMKFIMQNEDKILEKRKELREKYKYLEEANEKEAETYWNSKTKDCFKAMKDEELANK